MNEQKGRDGRGSRGRERAPVRPDAYPEDTMAERWLLNSLHGAPGDPQVVDAIHHLTLEDFSNPKHQVIFEAIKTVSMADDSVDLISIKKAMEVAGTLTEVGGFRGLQEIFADVEVGNIPHLVTQLKQHTGNRRLMALAANLGDRAKSGLEDPNSLIDAFSTSLHNIGQLDHRGSEPRAMSLFAEDASSRLLRRMTGETTPGVRVSWTSLDKMTQGFQGGNLIILAARPGVGKTSLALSWMHRASMRRDPSAGIFFSLEMSVDELWLRFLSLHSGIGLSDLKSVHPDLNDKIYAQVAKVTEDLKGLPISVSDTAVITVPEIHNHIRKLMGQGKPVDWVMIDYLQLLKSPDEGRNKNQNESTRIGEITRGLKLMAKDLNIPVVVLSQLNREVERREGRPQLSDLRDSGCIEQDSDIIMFIHRKTNAAVEMEGAQNQGELIVAKHRNGPTGAIPIFFKPECTLYREMERGGMGDDADMAPMGGGGHTDYSLEL
jgi:replicative DNA helicase